MEQAITLDDVENDRRYIYKCQATDATGAGLGCQVTASGTITGSVVDVRKLSTARSLSNSSYGTIPDDEFYRAVRFARDHIDDFGKFFEAILDGPCSNTGAMLFSSPINYYNPTKLAVGYKQYAFTVTHFIDWVKRNRKAVMTSSPVFVNPNHRFKTDTSLCQIWIIINPKYAAGSHTLGASTIGKGKMAKSKEEGLGIWDKQIKKEQSYGYDYDLTKTEYFKRY